MVPVERLDEASSLPRALFVREVARCLHPATASARAEREGEPLSMAGLEAIADPQQASVDQNGVRQALLRSRDGFPVLLVRRYGGAFDVSVAAADAPRAERLASSIVAAIRVEREARDRRIAVAFWSGPNDAFLGAPAPRWRKLGLPCFAEIEGNYPAATQSALGALFSHASGESLPGRLALWHGSPGTGKTWALRVLGREWSGWCDLHYITDPERFLGGDTSYMLGVLAGKSDPLSLDPDEDECGDRGCGDEERWRLLVLEDAGELLGIGAPTEVGRGFARLLNVADGLLGQGSRALILVTTNEPLGKLHPAALRPGRAMATIEFAPLGAGEANGWLRCHGIERRVDSPTTIAELHAMLADTPASPPALAPLGFG